MKGEDKAKEQLVVDANLRFDTSPAELAGMRRRIAELEATETERRGVEELLWKLTHDLGERVKELTCLYGISHLVEKPDISLEEIVQGAVDLFPPAWQHPEIACARVILEDQEFKTENFGETTWKQASDIVVHGERAGTIEVCYLEERPESHEGPFLKEEKSLLDAIAERLGRIIERNRAEAALRESEARYRALFDQANDAIFLENRNEEIVDVNRRACQLTGYSREELLAMRTPDLEAEEARLEPPHEIYSTPDVATEDTPFETAVLHRDGAEIPVEITITRLMSGGGDLFLSIVRDITERKRAEEALQRAHDELEQRVEERTAKLEAANEQLEREIEERKQAEEALRHLVKSENLMASIATYFINLPPDEIDAGINHALQAIGEFAGADRGYVFLLSDDGMEIDDAYEWCAAGIDPHIDDRKSLPLLRSSWWVEKLKWFETIHVPRVADLPPEASPQKETWLSPAIQSVIAVPMVYGGSLIGFLSFSSERAEKTWREAGINLLKTVADTLVSALVRKRTEEALRESEGRFRALFENAPLCMFEVDLGQTPPTVTRANRQAEQVYGWSSGEFAPVPMDKIVPPTAIPELARMVDALREGKTITLESINRRRDGSVFPVRVSAASETVADPSRIIFTIEDITAEKNRRSEEKAIAEERRRIAREIHDGLAQNLAALRFRDRLWHKLVDTDPAQMHAELDELREILSASIREVRRSIFALRPIALDELGFFPALHRFTAEFGEQYQLYVNLRIFGPEVRLPSSLELTLFRVVQEALNNVGKHAQASTVWIRLDVKATDAVALTIRDDGQGFDPASLSQAVRYGHLGLKQMRERVESASGTLSIQSQPGSGTKVRAVLPLEKS